MYWSMVRWSTESEQPYARDSSTLEMWNTSMKWNISHIFKNDLVHKGERVCWVGLSPRLIWKPEAIPDHLLLACLGTLVWSVVEDVKSGEKRWLNNLRVHIVSESYLTKGRNLLPKLMFLTHSPHLSIFVDDCVPDVVIWSSLIIMGFSPTSDIMIEVS